MMRLLTVLLLLQDRDFCFTRDVSGSVIPPEPRNKIIFPPKTARAASELDREDWTNNTENAWEDTNLFESDIMLSESSRARNVLRDKKKYWPKGIVPYYIEKKYFTPQQIKVIETAMQDIQDQTCVKFRPYKRRDFNYIIFTGKRGGCSSYVGRTWKGQEVNLDPSWCVTHGTVLHELLHALGMHHQHRSFNRDHFVKIEWDNIMEGKELSFAKVDASQVTNFDIPYDYASIMHYSSYACSKNGKPTIVPLMKNVTIGHRKGLSNGDVKKILTMYKCKNKKGGPFISG